MTDTVRHFIRSKRTESELGMMEEPDEEEYGQPAPPAPEPSDTGTQGSDTSSPDPAEPTLDPEIEEAEEADRAAAEARSLAKVRAEADEVRRRLNAVLDANRAKREAKAKLDIDRAMAARQPIEEIYSPERLRKEIDNIDRLVQSKWYLRDKISLATFPSRGTPAQKTRWVIDTKSKIRYLLAEARRRMYNKYGGTPPYYY